MARSTMATLIARTRVLISDTGGSPVFTDDQVEDTLDLHRTEMRQVPLQPGPSFAAGGAIVYKDWYSDTKNWESDVLLQDTGWNTLTPSVSEELVGHWHFTTQPNGLGVRATGKIYDLYGTAADLLDAWAAQVKLDFGFQNKTDIYDRNQKFQMLKQLATEYRKLALVRHSSLTQREANSDGGSNAVTYPAYGDSW